MGSRQLDSAALSGPEPDEEVRPPRRVISGSAALRKLARGESLADEIVDRASVCGVFDKHIIDASEIGSFVAKASTNTSWMIRLTGSEITSGTKSAAKDLGAWGKLKSPTARSAVVVVLRGPVRPTERFNEGLGGGKGRAGSWEILD